MHVACSELQIAPGQASEQEPEASLPSRYKALVLGLLNPVCFWLLSLRVSLLGWYFCLWKVQEDVVSYVRLSLEFCTNMFFCWAQHLLVGYMLLLLFIWKAYQRVQQYRALERQFFTKLLLLLLTCYWRLESLVAPIAWGPAYCITRLTSLVSWLLQAAFEHTITQRRERLWSGPQESSVPFLSLPLIPCVTSGESPDLPVPKGWLIRHEIKGTSWLCPKTAGIPPGSRL
uniref:Uncharacterized protein n=1 Tax=Gopherus evgoodei TaxID=1825980 RepID=A0A8C4WLH5_9SAUR